MTAPSLGPVRPSFKTADAPPVPDFGPDFTKTPADEAKTPPRVTRRQANKKGPDVKANPLGTLGTNKKMRSPVRKLTREAPSSEELSDLEKLTARYKAIGNMAAPFHPKFAAAMDMQAEDCALAWFELAEQNDTVRRWILALLEGGAWGTVIAAHTPIFLAVLPEQTLNRFFFKVMGVFSRNVSDEDEDDGNVMPFPFPGMQP